MRKSYVKFIKIANQKVLKIKEKSSNFSAIKKRVAKKTGLSLPSNADLREVYNWLVLKKKILPNPQLEKLLISKKIRTLSGVAVIAVLTKPYRCPGKCLYCPSEKEMPKSYLSNEPAVMRAIASHFNPYRQVQNRLKSLELNGHCVEKIELIVMGGTFSFLPHQYQKKFICECFRASNDYPKNIPSNNKTNLEKEQKKNEKSRIRIIGLTLETRPDYINISEALNFRYLGCTRVELGAQNISDEILKINQRGHGVSEIIDATKILKNFGFKISYHMMPGLLGSSMEKDLEMFKKLFQNSGFQPDLIKIYPCVVTLNSPLYKIWQEKKFIPLNNNQTQKLLGDIKKIIPPYVRISRLIRDIPENSIIAGPKVSNLRQILAQKKIQCQCIRCREIRENFSSKEKIILSRIDYNASDGKEIFLQYVSLDQKKLFALLRLRMNPSLKSEKINKYPKILEKTAIIRELHTYGKIVGINKKKKTSPQHIGLGKKLILEAEKIASKEFNCKKIIVISGVGVRNYYRKLGYKLKDTYLVKKI